MGKEMIMWIYCYDLRVLKGLANIYIVMHMVNLNRITRMKVKTKSD